MNVFYPPQAIGGATRVVADNIGDILVSYGNKFLIEVFTTLEGGGEPYVPLSYFQSGVKVTAIPTPLDANIDRKIWDSRMGEYFERTVNKFQPDLVHFHCIQRITLSACEVVRRKSIPYVVTVHDGWWISDDQFLLDQHANYSAYNYDDPLTELQLGGVDRLERMRTKQAVLEEAKLVLAVSEPFAVIYRNCGFSNVITVANGVSRFEVLPRIPSLDGRVRMAHVGGTSFHKGYNLIQAALTLGEFKNLHLLVIDHAMDPDARRSAMWGSTEVTFRGKVPQAKVGELYREIDVLLAPSVWPESYGLVTREAMVAGCWVVASDRGAIGADVDSTSGVIVDVSSPAALYGIFDQLNQTSNDLVKKGRSNQDLYRSQDQANSLAELYVTLLSKRVSE